jgi:hypothetical protein
MAVLFISMKKDPVEAFFYATPPRQVMCCGEPTAAIAALLQSQCNHRYALVPDSVEVPDGLEVRARRPGFVLLQKKGQRTRSDRRKELPFGGGKLPVGERPRPPYFTY